MQCARPHELNPNQSWGAHRPRVLLDAPRIQPFRAPQLPEFPELSMFSARARKTALEARALPIYSRLSSLPEIEADEAVLAAGEKKTISQRGKRAHIGRQDLHAGRWLESFRRGSCAKQ